jgi:hypothetical protein
MKLQLLTLLSLALAGCNESASSSGAIAYEPIGRWVVAPVTVNGNDGLYHAWRIDTQTGALEMCVYALTWANKDVFGTLTLVSPKCSSQPTLPPGG